MRQRRGGVLVVGALAVLVVSLGAAPASLAGAGSDATDLAPPTVSSDVIRSKVARFVPAELGHPGKIDAKLLPIVRKLVEAADYLDTVFWKQVSPHGLELFRAYSARADDASRDIARLLQINYGPWDRLSAEEPFLGVPPRPVGASFYPPDLSRREVDAYLDSNPGDLAMFADPYSLVRRKNGGFMSVPYAKAYAAELDRAARALREAAALSRWDSLRRFLVARADALLSNDYLESEMLWLDTGDSPLIVAVGPYEFYEDRLLNSKVAFEAIIALRDEAESARVGKMCAHLDEALEQLPLPDVVRRTLRRTPGVPITIANVLYTAGDTRAGAQTTAFSLPNDARVVRKKGRWKVVLRNVAQAKFLHSWMPLMTRVIADEQAAKVTFESYYRMLLLGELSRGVEVQPIATGTGDGAVADPRAALRQRYNVIEEARTDAVTLLIGLTMADKKPDAAARSEQLMATYLGAVFRVLRFGSGPHETAKAIGFNYLARRGVFRYDPTIRRYRVEMKNAREAVKDLAAGLVGIVAKGDYRAAGTLIAEHGVLPGDVRSKLAELKDVPVDIYPVYTIREQLGE